MNSKEVNVDEEKITKSTKDQNTVRVYIEREIERDSPECLAVCWGWGKKIEIEIE